MAFCDPTSAEWLPLAAAVLGLPPAEVMDRAAVCSFTELGGTSLRAAEYVARLAQECGRAVDMNALLGLEPLAKVGPGYPAVSRIARAVPQASGSGGVCRSQEGMLLAEQLWGCEPSAFHLLFSASIRGRLQAALLKSALAHITRRHAALRTVFTRDLETGFLGTRVLAAWNPVIIEQALPPVPSGVEPVDLVHAQLAPTASRLLRPFAQPPVVFVLTHAGPGHAVLSILAHHAVVDGWSIGMLWEQIAAEYAALDRGELAAIGEVAPGMDLMTELERAAATRGGPAGRAAELEGWPTLVEIPSDVDRPQTRSTAGCRLAFGLSASAHAGCGALASAAGVTRNAVLLAAWGLVIARRAGINRLLMGVPAAGRTTAESRQVIGCCAKLLPVQCEVPADGSVVAYVRQTARRLREALEFSDVPFEDIVAAVGAGGGLSRGPLVQVAFGAHDELVPSALTAGDLTFDIREGYCGGTAFDAILYLQRWHPSPVLSIEYATSALDPAEAASLATSLGHTLAEMAATMNGPVADVTTITCGQRQQLISAGSGPAADTSAGLWDLIADAASRNPEAIAVRDTDPARKLTYRELITAAGAQSAELAAAGVREGDCVAVAVRRSLDEIVTILAILRLGAAYTGLDIVIPPAVAAAMLDQAGVKVITGEPGRLAALGTASTGRQAIPIISRGPVTGETRFPPAAAPNPERTAYIAFTSGSTGFPKGTMVACRGVVRLARDPAYLRPGACARFLRLAPLAFDASTLEIFAPLLAGGTVEVFPGSHVTPDALAAFLTERAITGLWLTAGLFRLAADYCPDAFSEVIQMLTGGDVVPPQQVARVLRACPGLRITNGYGPTENTTFTTAFHVDDPATAEVGALPIGRPIGGTGVLVLDHAGHLVPPGGIGELYAYGDGLARGYAGMPAETAEAFGKFSSDIGHPLYRTGDLARWDGTWNLRFLGRSDRQLKIRGFRVEPDYVASVLRKHPAVRDAAVTAISSADGARQILAAVIAPPDQALPGTLRSFAAEQLPGYAVPSLWAIVEDFPLTPNGKLDVARLTELSTAFGPSLARPHADNATPVPSGEASVGEDEVEQAIAQAWQEVLGHRDFGRYDRFLDIGGDSLQLLRVHAILRRTLTHWPVTMTDLYTRPAIADLASTLRAHANAFNGQNRKSEPQLSLHDGLELRRAPPGLRGDAANPGMERLMIARVGINGLGRIGRGFMRVALAMKNDLDIVAVNDPADNRLIAYLCQYDTLHGIFPEPVQADMHYLRIGDNQIGAFSEADPAAIPWDDFGVDIVVEASGRFANRAAASKHLASGAKRVLIASVAEDADATIIMGVNDDRLDPSRHRIISNSLCTAHCAAVMLKVLHDKFGVNNANMTTLHAYTNRQVLLDNPREDTRLSRSGTVNIIPSATPIARSVALTLPELDGRVDGLAIRIPVRGGSLVDLVAHLNTRVTEREINAAFRKDADGPLKRVLDYTEDPIISSDILGSAASCIFDAGLTITQGEYIKIIGWYDNEWGYCNRLADLARLTASQIG